MRFLCRISKTMVDVGRLKRIFRKMCPKNKCFIATKGCDMPANSVNKETTILGFTMMPAQRRKATKKDAGRVQEATYRAKRCAVLSGGHSRRTRLARMAVPTKAAWGMLCRQPTKREQTSFFLLAKQVNKCTFGRNKLARTCCGSCLGILGI